MSLGLIDWIFANLEVQKLDKKQVLDYLTYLEEITAQESSIAKMEKYRSYKVALKNRLAYFDQEIDVAHLLTPSSRQE